MKRNKNNSLFDPVLLRRSLRASFTKLDPRQMIKNPIMFTVEAVTFAMLLLIVRIAVTELLSPPASRITGADSPVMALSSIDARPSTISPSAATVSPATHSNRSPCFSSELLTMCDCPSGSMRLAGVSSRVLRSESACALPRASAMASAKLAKSTVKRSTAKITRL